MSLGLPQAARTRALAAGPQGAAWLEGLPGLVEGVARDWNLTLGATLDGGSEAFVALATDREGRAAVLKVIPPHRDPASREVETLLAARGRGYARVLAYDPGRRALLLERLGRQLAEMGWPVDRQIEALCEALQAAWRPLEDPAGFMTGAQKAQSLAQFTQAIWREMGRPCSERTVETALSYAREREAAFDPGAAVLAHGDAHAWNALQVPGEDGFKFVDPDGLFIERAYDLGIAMREWAGDLLAGDPVGLGARRCRRLAELTGVDAEAIWQWGFMERVSSGMLCLKLGIAEGREMLAVADAWAGGLAD